MSYQQSLLKINGVRVCGFKRFKMPALEPLEHDEFLESNRAKRVNYCRDFACFDIETSRIPERDQSFLYIAQFYFADQVIICRTWEEVLEMFDKISDALDGMKLLVFVHNLSYEAQFMLGQFRFDSMFILDRRKIVKMTYKNLEFRCSYIQTNMSLKLFTKGCKHEKLDGEEFDYESMRYPWTELTKEKLQYCVNDVVGLHEAIEKRLKTYNDTLYTMPLTSTGYVRRLAKDALKPHAGLIKKSQPDEKTYLLLRECFRGGDTHANRYYANKICKDVISYDESSAYPFVMINEKYPYKFEPLKSINKGKLNRIMHTSKAVICRMKISDVALKNEFETIPYLAYAKCRNVKSPELDNGRILACKYCEISVTEIDYRIIEEQYNFTVLELSDVYTAKKSKLPEELRQLICDLFRQKTELKGIDGMEEMYMKSKNLLNSVYGMMVTDTLRDAYIYDYETGEYKEGEKPDYDKAIKNAFMLYQWGVYVTAYARNNLHKGIKIAGENHIYNDTDSVKFIADESIIQAFEDYNNSITDTFTAYDKKGKAHTLGLFEFDGHYSEFKTLGAKKYGYIEDGKLHLTISGVNKIEGAEELERAGGLSAMQEGFIFVDAGGLEAVYNDDLRYESYYVDGKEIPITRNVCLKPSTYTLGLSAEYERLLKYIQIQLE